MCRADLEICFDCLNKLDDFKNSIQNNPYKIVSKASDYPANISHAYPLQSGDTIVIQDVTPVKVGDKYKNFHARVIQIFYKPKKWWQFWKKKEQLGYMVEWE